MNVARGSVHDCAGVQLPLVSAGVLAQTPFQNQIERMQVVGVIGNAELRRVTRLGCDQPRDLSLAQMIRLQLTGASGLFVVVLRTQMPELACHLRSPWLPF